MLNSKQLIELTGISRATLNNYVALGILPSPVIKTPESGDSRTTRLGYFPEEALDRIKKVQQLKKDGMTIARIAKQMTLKAAIPYPLSNTPDSETAELNAVPVSKASQGREPFSHLSIELSVENFTSPAYMVNNNFELIWWNEHAVDQIFGEDVALSGDLESRNLLNMLVKDVSDTSESFANRILPHLAAAKKRLSHQMLIKIYSSLTGKELRFIEKLYQSANTIGKEPIVHYPITLLDDDGEAALCDLYVCFYREGILFAYNPIELDDNYLLDFLAQRNQVIRELLKNRKPYLSHVAVMVADLQNSVRICSELPAEEYFELINNIWQESEPIFRKYYGTYGKHAGDGMVYYFFPQPDCDYILNTVECSLELQEMMKRLTQKWQARKGWFTEIMLNIGLNEGQEWFGSYHAGAHVEFTVLGETINYAARISDFARDGSIWVTKSMLNQVPVDRRRTIHFGVPRKIGNNETVFVNDTYANVGNLLNPDNPMNPKFRDIEMIPVTQIRAINPSKS